MIMYQSPGELRELIVANVPTAMQQEPRWVLWRAEDRDGKPSKVPYHVGGGRAKSNDPSTWSDLRTALSAYEGARDYYSGVGFVLGNGWWGLDVDRPVLMHPDPTERVLEIGGYAETSVSGNGFHVIGYDKSLRFEHKQIPEVAEDGSRVTDESGHQVMTEFYSYPDQVGGRFFTVTGMVLQHQTRDSHEVASLMSFLNFEMWCRMCDREGKAPKAAEVPAPAQTTHTMVGDESEGEELRSALGAIDPSRLSYDEWLAVGMELKARGCDADVWDEWSRGDSARYREGECAYKWSTFPAEIEPGKTIFRLANDSGWRWVPQGSTFWDNVDEYDPAPVPADATKQPDDEQPREEDRKPWINLAEYMAPGGAWDRERQKRRDLGLVSTGWKEFDRAIGGGLVPDLYLIGGAPGLGKTTVALQMADQVAAQGWAVCYVCTEQTQFELACKSVSRTAYLTGATSEGDDHPMTALGLITGYFPARGRSMADEYLSKPTPRIIPCDFNESVESVAAKVDRFEREVRSHGDNRPIMVVIDYLQLLRSDTAGPNASEREVTDCKVRALKAMQQNNGDPRIMVVLSSFNREVYKDVSQVAPTMAAFKESGSIEYTAAVCVALWRFAGVKRKGEWAIEPDVDKPEKSVIRARLVKNRYGQADRTVWMVHHKLFDYVETMSYEDMQSRGLVAEDPDNEDA